MVEIGLERNCSEVKIIIGGLIDDKSIEDLKQRASEFLDDVKQFDGEKVHRVLLDFSTVEKITSETGSWVATLSAFLSGLMAEGIDVALEGVDQNVCDFLEKSGMGKVVSITPRD